MTPKEKASGLTQDSLKKLVDYNPDTGVMTWKVREVNRSQDKTWNKVWAGKEVGYVSGKDQGSRHRIAVVNHVQYGVHRLVVLFMTGSWPDGEVDHINGKHADNRWCNLRVVTGQQNKWNRGPLKHNKLGVRGVWYNAKMEKYNAYIEYNYVRYNLGWYKDLDEAIDARTKAAVKFYGDYAFESRERVINEKDSTPPAL